MKVKRKNIRILYREDFKEPRTIWQIYASIESLEKALKIIELVNFLRKNENVEVIREGENYDIYIKIEPEIHEKMYIVAIDSKYKVKLCNKLEKEEGEQCLLRIYDELVERRKKLLELKDFWEEEIEIPEKFAELLPREEDGG